MHKMGRLDTFLFVLLAPLVWNSDPFVFSLVDESANVFYFLVLNFAIGFDKVRWHFGK